MRSHEVDAKGKAAGGSAANGAVSSKRRKRRSWGLEDKIRVARESFATDETVASMARRYGISRYRLSSWRSLLRRGKLVAPSSAQAGPAGVLAAVEMDSNVVENTIRPRALNRKNALFAGHDEGAAAWAITPISS